MIYVSSILFFFPCLSAETSGHTPWWWLVYFIWIWLGQGSWPAFQSISSNQPCFDDSVSGPVIHDLRTIDNCQLWKKLHVLRQDRRQIQTPIQNRYKISNFLLSITDQDCNTGTLYQFDRHRGHTLNDITQSLCKSDGPEWHSMDDSVMMYPHSDDPASVQNTWRTSWQLCPRPFLLAAKR